MLFFDSSGFLHRTVNRDEVLSARDFSRAGAFGPTGVSVPVGSRRCYPRAKALGRVASDLGGTPRLVTCAPELRRAIELGVSLGDQGYGNDPRAPWIVAGLVAGLMPE